MGVIKNTELREPRQQGTAAALPAKAGQGQLTKCTTELGTGELIRGQEALIPRITFKLRYSVLRSCCCKISIFSSM